MDVTGGGGETRSLVISPPHSDVDGLFRGNQNQPLVLCKNQRRFLRFFPSSPLFLFFLWDLGETYVLWEVPPRRLCGSLRGEGDTMTSPPPPGERGVRFRGKVSRRLMRLRFSPRSGEQMLPAVSSVLPLVLENSLLFRHSGGGFPELPGVPRPPRLLFS